VPEEKNNTDNNEELSKSVFPLKNKPPGIMQVESYADLMNSILEPGDENKHIDKSQRNSQSQS
jgi:hypothetical protein